MHTLQKIIVFSGSYLAFFGFYPPLMVLPGKILGRASMTNQLPGFLATL